MSQTTTDSDDIVFSKDQIESPFAEDSCGGNANGGIVLKKGPWTAAEDAILIDYVKKHGEGNWNAVQKHSGLSRCGKSCRLRWANHLRPNLKKGAFTPEEEQLIIELHAKMGNKWAQMAGHLPGRTDNEIKNYWNTRIKRRQRAGLPLYPPEVSMQALQENQPSLSMGGIFAADKGHHDLLQHNSYEIPDVIFDQFKANQGISPYAPELQGLGSSQYGSFISPELHRQKRLRESATIVPGYAVKREFPLFEQFQDGPACGLSSQFEPSPSNGNQEHSFCENQGSHALENGNISASKPSLGLVKLELPSLQYPDDVLGSWGTPPPPLLETVNTFIHSPNAGIVQPSPQNSGLLDALLYEARTRGKNHSSDKSSNSSTVTPGEPAETSAMNMSATEWEEFGDPLSPLGHAGCTPISNGDTFTGCKVKSEPVDYSWSPERVEETSTQLDRTRPDVLFGWLGQGSGYIKETDNIATLLGSDLSSDYKQMSAGASAVNKGRGLGSCAWNAMPAVCQMSELP